MDDINKRKIGYTLSSGYLRQLPPQTPNWFSRRLGVFFLRVSSGPHHAVYITAARGPDLISPFRIKKLVGRLTEVTLSHRGQSLFKGKQASDTQIKAKVYHSVLPDPTEL
jgi:hypothetical protein